MHYSLASARGLWLGWCWKIQSPVLSPWEREGQPMSKSLSRESPTSHSRPPSASMSPALVKCAWQPRQGCPKLRPTLQFHLRRIQTPKQTRSNSAALLPLLAQGPKTAASPQRRPAAGEGTGLQPRSVDVLDRRWTRAPLLPLSWQPRVPGSISLGRVFG